ncbi:MAG: septum formation initiator family protein [bacterium]
MGKTSPFGDYVPAQPKVGSGRAALAKRARARGGGERKDAARAARRGLSRSTNNRRVRQRADPAKLASVRRGFGVLASHTRHFKQRFLEAKRLRHLVIVIAAGWAIWTFVLGDASVPRLFTLRHRNAKLTTEVEQLDREQQALEKDVRALASGDRATVEKIARDEHAMVREGEVLVRFFEPGEEQKP